MCRCRPRAATPGRPLGGDEGEGPQMSELARDPRHDPVLREEVVAALAIAPGERHVDATFAAGGYTRAMLAAGAELIACARAPDPIAEGQALVAEAHWPPTLLPRLFGVAARLHADAVLQGTAGILFHLGVTSKGRPVWR